MTLLLDTHLLLWAAVNQKRVPERARVLISDAANELWFSAASIWEVAIKAGRKRPDFNPDAPGLRQYLFDNGYRELPVSSRHAVRVAELPMIHRDPFDRILIAQAQVEDVTLLTTDRVVARYPGPVLLV